MARGRKKQTPKERSYKNPNGYGSVYKLSGNRRKPYIVRVSTGWDLLEQDGKFKKKQKYFTIGYAETFEQGSIMLADYHKKKNAGIITLKSDPTFKDIYEAVLPNRLRNKSNSLKNSYNAAFKSLEPIHNIPVSQIKTLTMQNMIDAEYQKGKRTNSLSNIKIVCNMVFENAYQNDLVNKNYAEFLQIPKTEKLLNRIPFSADEIKILWDNISMPYVDTILIMIYTGIRINELLKIKNSDVHLDDRYFITGSKTDAGKDRIIPIPYPIKSIIIKYFDPNKIYLLHDDKNIKYTSQKYRKLFFNEIMKQLNMSHLPHDCRHTYASITDTAGMNKVVQQRILGHKGNDVTESVYIHKSIEELLIEVDKIWPNIC